MGSEIKHVVKKSGNVEEMQTIGLLISLCDCLDMDGLVQFSSERSDSYTW